MFVSRTRPPFLAQLASRLLPVRPWTPAELCEEADRRAGRSDPDPEPVLEPLRRIAADLAARPPTPLGRFMLRTTLVDGLVLRRRLAALPPGRPTRPLVVVGWYRTGTTALQHLLAGLEGYGTVPMHRMLNPVAVPGSRIRTALGIGLMSQVAPELGVLHPLSAEGPEECWPLFMAHVMVEGLAFHWELPRYFDWLQSVDRTPAYRTWATALEHLEREFGHQLVLKDPAHLLALDTLREVVPDALLVQTHRDPAASVASYASLTAVQHRSVYGRLDRRRAGNVMMDRTIRGLRAGVDGDHGDILHVDHAALADPDRILHDIAAHFDLRVERVPALPQRVVHDTQLHDWGLDPERVDAVLGAFARSRVGR